MVEKKRVREEVGGKQNYPPSIYLEKGESVTGEYTETHEVETTDKKGVKKMRPVYILNVEGTFVDSKGQKHTNEKGTLWGSGLLNTKMAEIKIGETIEVVFEGQVKDDEDKTIKYNQHKVYRLK